jgi:hypothetical protein
VSVVKRARSGVRATVWLGDVLYNGKVELVLAIVWVGFSNGIGLVLGTHSGHHRMAMLEKKIEDVSGLGRRSVGVLLLAPLVVRGRTGLTMKPLPPVRRVLVIVAESVCLNALCGLV